MCRAFYKYFLITGTSFLACGGLYFVCLSRFLWPFPIMDYTENKYDWRDVPLYSGILGMLIFTPGLMIVIRAKAKELQYYGIFLCLPFVMTLIALIIQLCSKKDILDPTDWYLLGLALSILAIIVNIFLFINEINTYGNHQLIASGKYQNENAV